MGYIAHHAIVVTSSFKRNIERAHAIASKIFPKVSPVLDSGYNSYSSFFIPPDGSKEGWPESEEEDAQRKLFMDMMKEQSNWRLPDPLYVSCVEVRYGGDTDEALITRDHAKDREREP